MASLVGMLGGHPTLRFQNLFIIWNGNNYGLVNSVQNEHKNELLQFLTCLSNCSWWPVIHDETPEVLVHGCLWPWLNSRLKWYSILMKPPRQIFSCEQRKWAVNLSVTEPINPALYSDGPIWVTSAKQLTHSLMTQHWKSGQGGHGIWFICIQNNIMCYISSCIFIYWLCHWEVFWQQFAQGSKDSAETFEICTSSLWSFYITLIFIQFHCHLTEQNRKKTAVTHGQSSTLHLPICIPNVSMDRLYHQPWHTLYHSYLSWFKTQNMASTYCVK